MASSKVVKWSKNCIPWRIQLYTYTYYTCTFIKRNDIQIYVKKAEEVANFDFYNFTLKTSYFNQKNNFQNLVQVHVKISWKWNGYNFLKNEFLGFICLELVILGLYSLEPAVWNLKNYCYNLIFVETSFSLVDLRLFF